MTGMMADFEIPESAISEARARIAGHVLRTPLVRGGLGGLLKLETQQPTGSFKVRPAFNSLLARLDECRARGVVTSSSGNFAQAVAFASRALGIDAAIVMPSNTPAFKVDRTRAFGGTVHLSGPSFDARWALMEKIRAESNRLVLHPYDTVETMAGDATIAVELLEQAREQGAALETVLVPCSGGGMLAGIATALKRARPAIKVFGVQPENNGSMARSFKAHARVKSGAFTTIAEALAAAEPGEHTFAVIERVVDGIVNVTEDEMRAAVKWCALEQKLVVEPGGAAGMAAVLAGRAPGARESVACVVSGGNIAPALLAEIIAG